MEPLTVKDLQYTYRSKYQMVEALKGVSCSFEAGNMYAIVGHSGSGKSTLLSLLAGLDIPTGGEILVEGRPLKERNRDTYRRETASVVYQSFNLFPLLTALENVMYPLQLRGTKRVEAANAARKLIKDVGLGEKAYKQLPGMMSGGEQQRVAIARALASGGRILLADEPTGNLDSENEAVIIALLQRLAHEQGYLVIVVTHNDEVATAADHVLKMRDGRLTQER